MCTKKNILNIAHKCADEPFRLFFPLGTFLTLIGVSFWMVRFYGWGFTQTSTKFHVWIQIYGYLTAFIIGFLGTALPRLRQAKKFTLGETGILFALMLIIYTFLYIDIFKFAHITFVILLTIFLFFLFKRIVASGRKYFPESFVYIPFGFLAALFSSITTVLVLHKKWPGSVLYYQLAELMIFQGFILFLLLGVGGFLIRSILGWGAILPTSDRGEIELPAPDQRKFIFHLITATIIFSSFIIEIFHDELLGRVLRAIFTTLSVIYQIKIHKKSKSGKLTAGWLQFSLWLLVAGLWTNTLFDQTYRLSYLHLCFIGGFSLSTFSIATRVIFSHCGYSQLLKGRYIPFDIAALFMVGGLATRFLADFMGKSYDSHINYASFLWVIGLIIWIYFVLFKCIKDTLFFDKNKIEGHASQ